VAVKLNQLAYNHAKRLIERRQVVLDQRDDWSEHQPSAAEENKFLERHGFGEYQKWYLGVDDQQDEDNKSRYRFPYGDFERVHRCGVLSAEVRAGQNDYNDIQVAAGHLHGLIDALAAEKEPGGSARRR
jgi:hypothetical protein